jgi:hypothetical protein
MGRLRYGRHVSLEEMADGMIKKSLQGVTSYADKSDILTPWKQEQRYRREVYVASGTPDSQLRRGMFGRVLNRAQPHLNARDGFAVPRRAGTNDSLEEFVDGQGGGGWPSGGFDERGDG